MSPHGLLNPITTNHRSTTNVSQESNHRTHRVPYPSTVCARSTDPLIQLARISCRHGQHDIRSVDYYCSNRGSNELTSPLRNRDLRRLAICQNRVWLWDLFPKRSRTISPTVFRFAMLAFSVYPRPPSSFSTGTRFQTYGEMLVSPLEKTGNATLRENNMGRCDGLMAERHDRKKFSFSLNNFFSI